MQHLRQPVCQALPLTFTKYLSIIRPLQPAHFSPCAYRNAQRMLQLHYHSKTALFAESIRYSLWIVYKSPRYWRTSLERLIWKKINILKFRDRKERINKLPREVYNYQKELENSGSLWKYYFIIRPRSSLVQESKQTATQTTGSRIHDNSHSNMLQ